MELPERVSPPLTFGEFSEVIDVRSPQEYEEDHLPGAINLPVLDNEQRHEVGQLNARNSFEARRLGATLITQNIHQHLTTVLQDRPRTYSPLIYCWRGNLRSSSMAVIFRAIGWRARVLEGGYKAWRRWLINDLESRLSQSTPSLIVLAGLTGCGKTRLLHELRKQGAQVLDLEGHANHKGSILGNPLLDKQPSQKTFESRLWQDLERFDHSRPVFTEAESNRIGNVHCPASLWQRLHDAQVAQINLPLQERARFLIDDYPHFIDHPEQLKEILDGLRRLRGNQQVDEWHQQIDQRDWTSFLESILLNHYDCAYRKSGTEESIYQTPSHHLELEAFTPTAFVEGAASLIQHYNAV